MKTFFESYPFSPMSGKILEMTPSSRVERYFRRPNFEGDFFDIEYVVDAAGNDVSFNIIKSQRQ